MVADLPFSILIWGGLLSAAMSALILFLLWYRPRSLLHQFPATLQARVPPKTADEKRVASLSIAVSLLLVLGLPIAVSLSLEHGPVEAFLHAAGMLLVLQVVDLVLLDWLLLCTITPDFVTIPGTKGAPEYKDYRHHAIGFARGMVLVLLAALLTALASFVAGYLV
ncbi:hypothetical protein [Paracoccus sp. TOH]|uniref:hypothetical protein n=1 Tax=Paracoccus sp. TOH TaxID=1263728 RepID=UPI0025B03B7A|nr:hypothetical protein [Paracoccus sp. TOH]WJS87118.1 hypothetical protein NBE95_21025 [Paracoccus sp. TOH]